jgi:hypothetical protein
MVIQGCNHDSPSSDKKRTVPGLPISQALIQPYMPEAFFGRAIIQLGAVRMYLLRAQPVGEYCIPDSFVPPGRHLTTLASSIISPVGAGLLEGTRSSQPGVVCRFGVALGAIRCSYRASGLPMASRFLVLLGTYSGETTSRLTIHSYGGVKSS